MTRERCRRLLTSAFLALALLYPAVAWTQEAEPEPAPPAPDAGSGPGRGACHGDVQRFCADARGVPRGVATCLRDHEDELSDPCRDQLKRLSSWMRGAGSRMRVECEDELERFCSDMKRGEGGIVRCLREHDSELSDACRDALPDRPPRGGGQGKQGPGPR